MAKTKSAQRIERLLNYDRITAQRLSIWKQTSEMSISGHLQYKAVVELTISDLQWLGILEPNYLE